MAPREIDRGYSRSPGDSRVRRGDQAFAPSPLNGYETETASADNFRLPHEHSSDFESSRPHTHKFTHKGTPTPQVAAVCSEKDDYRK
jgi:hypothetical protein